MRCRLAWISWEIAFLLGRRRTEGARGGYVTGCVGRAVRLEVVFFSEILNKVGLHYDILHALWLATR